MAEIPGIFFAFLRLGLTSFGGPVAHLGYYRAELVYRRRWLDDATFADIVALTQSLPGPGSTQVCYTVGLLRGGLAGGLAAWLGFTLPSAILMTLFAYGITWFHGPLGVGALHGLRVVAVAVVAQAVYGMARRLCPDLARGGIAIVAALIGQAPAILIGGLAGLVLCRRAAARVQSTPLHVPIKRAVSIGALIVFAVLLAALPLCARLSHNHAVELFDSFYRTGAMVFGGGHVVLPLLETSVVRTGWMGNQAFLAGYGAAQAIPGPLFTFSAYLGAAMAPAPHGVVGAAICLIAIFLPGLLLVTGALPFWNELRSRAWAQAVLAGVNAAVVGLLAAAFYKPVWTGTIFNLGDFAFALAAFLALAVGKAPPLWVVLGGALAGALLGVLG